ncbi:HD domain-containing phosphohydrolase [Vibrio salinus]|uniref:HD domain-containing phosphohydrolase n=1 Tax=Vibrio salinus TaxID=2899784 RepID=UPI001E342198|nr:HD domain-containing phosphohydrolase [Vibrio salinus]MCE0495882.1 transporter substrate-binding domain-containing protein [Vibrio salinus]
MVNKLSQMKFSIKLTVISLFIFLSLLIVAVALSLQFYFSQSLAKESAGLLFKNSAQRVSDKINALDTESSDLALLLSQYPEMTLPDSTKTIRPITKIMAQAMRQKPYLYAIYIGYENGNFYELVNLNSSKNLRKRLKADEDDRWLIVHIYSTAERRLRQFTYFNSQFIKTHERTEPSRYFANVRPWFRQAMQADETIKTSPYLFHNTQTPGTTYAKKIPLSNNVIAVDLSMATLSRYLQQHRSLEESNTIIFDRSGKIFAHSFEKITSDKIKPDSTISLTKEEQKYITELGVLRVSSEKNWPPYDFSYGGEPQGYSIDLFNLIAGKLGLKVEYSNGYNWNELVDLYSQNRLDILHSLFQTPQRESWGLFSDPYLELSPVLVTNTKDTQITSLKTLNNGKTIAIPAGWAFIKFVKQHYPDIKILETTDTLSSLKALISGKADAAFDNNAAVHFFVDRYSLEGLQFNTKLPSLVGTLDQQLRFLVHDGREELRDLLNKGIHSVSASELAQLKNKWFYNQSQTKLHRTIQSGVVPNPEFTKLAIQSKENKADTISQSIVIGDTSYTVYVHHTLSAIGPDNYVAIMIPTWTIQKPYMHQVNISLLITLGFLVLLTPLLFILAKMIVTPVNLLANENKKIMERRFKEVECIPSRILEINDLSNSILSMAESIEDYQTKQQELVDAFIQLIAKEIDEKSPFTGAHCERVPEIAMMLARSASDSSLPAFKDFKLESIEQWREFKIAAWLHDCGKVTTPEHIIDKGSKLETIYNRIHEIRTRFEVLWRDAEIDFWKGIADGKPKEKLQQILLNRHDQITKDFSFIAECNIGKDYTDEEKIVRIKEIAQQTWVRHLDNRLGLSPLETKNLESIPGKALPATEHILMDTREHIIPWIRSPKDRVSSKFKVEIPENQANLGEIYNLSITKGTLTNEDRYRINEHIISTIQILESLPLPDELSRVPEIAGGHHEKLDGTGYPQKLTANELSLEARILAIADVFEALTASDRPYKHAKTLSEAIEILACMVKEQHLDENLFKLLLANKIHEQYAERFLSDTQHDPVDINKYL